MEKKVMVVLSILVIFIFGLIFLSGCNRDIGLKGKFDIDFSNPPERISTPSHDAKVIDGNDKIIIVSPCQQDWSLFTQRSSDTNSMDPTFDSGNTIIACKINDYKLQVGDVVVFNRKPNNPITHRIISIDGYNYTIKGDNLDVPEYVNLSQITHYILGVIY